MADLGATAALGLSPFRPRWPWIGRDLQTIRNPVAARFGNQPPPITGYPGERMIFEMPDGTGDRLVGLLNHSLEASDQPLVVLIHGLTGCQDSLYMLSTAAELLKRGYPVLRINLRGAGPSRSYCRQQYHAGRSGDLRSVLAALDPVLTEGGLALIGYSLGANMMLKFLGEEGQNAAGRIWAAVSISAPIDLAATCRRMMARRNGLYHRWLLARMKDESLSTAADLTDNQRRSIGQARSVFDFDNDFVAPANGFHTAERYYAINGAKRFLGLIRVPALIIHAADDPWIPMQSYQEVDWKENRHLLPVLTAKGGHVGFHGRGSLTPWHDRAIVRFLERVTSQRQQSAKAAGGRPRARA